MVMIQVFLCTNTREYTNIPSCRGKLVFDSSRLQEGIFVYTLVKLYNNAYLSHMRYILHFHVLDDVCLKKAIFMSMGLVNFSPQMHIASLFDKKS